MEYPLPAAATPGPFAMAAGPDGNLWYVDTGDGRIGRLTPSTGAVMTWQAASGSDPLDITAGPDGNLWFTEFIGDQITQLTPAGVFTRYPLPTKSAFPVGIVADGSGNLVFMEISKIGRIVAATGAITSEFPLPAGQPAVINSEGGQIVVGPDGNFWFTNGVESIIRMTPAGVMTRYGVPGANPGVSGLTVGPDGYLWFTDLNQNIIGRIAP